MAIEAVNGAMTYQTAPLNHSTKSAAENTDGELQQDNATKVDFQTAKVENSQATDENGDNSQNSEENSSQKETEKIKKYIDDLNKKMNNSEAQFGIHEETNRVTIKIVDKDTKKVIKEFPPEKTLDMIAKVWKMAGILVDEKR